MDKLSCGWISRRTIGLSYLQWTNWRACRDRFLVGWICGAATNVTTGWQQQANLHVWQMSNSCLDAMFMVVGWCYIKNHGNITTAWRNFMKNLSLISYPVGFITWYIKSRTNITTADVILCKTCHWFHIRSDICHSYLDIWSDIQPIILVKICFVSFRTDVVMCWPDLNNYRFLFRVKLQI